MTSSLYIALNSLNQPTGNLLIHNSGFLLLYRVSLMYFLIIIITIQIQTEFYCNITKKKYISINLQITCDGTGMQKLDILCQYKIVLIRPRQVSSVRKRAQQFSLASTQTAKCRQRGRSCAAV